MTQNPRILAVDDDAEILALLVKYLSQQGFEAEGAATLRDFRDRLKAGRPDLIVLDITLPDGSGLDECMQLRRSGDRTPVILLTAMSEELDRIIGLEMGADDYMSKPFNPRELTARIKAVLRRADPSPPTAGAGGTYRFEGFTADPEARTVMSPSDSHLSFTSAEFDVLMVFLASPGRVVTRDHILNSTHSRSSEPFDRSVDVLMSRIRKKLREEGAPADMFKTVRNGGYQLTCKVVTG